MLSPSEGRGHHQHYRTDRSQYGLVLEPANTPTDTPCCLDNILHLSLFYLFISFMSLQRQSRTDWLTERVSRTSDKMRQLKIRVERGTKVTNIEIKLYIGRYHQNKQCYSGDSMHDSQHILYKTVTEENMPACQQDRRFIFLCRINPRTNCLSISLFIQ